MNPLSQPGWSATHTYKTRNKNTLIQQSIIPSLTGCPQTNQQPLTNISETTPMDLLHYGIKHGNTLAKKNNNLVRIISQNINGLPLKKLDPKSHQCFSFLQNNRLYDVALWQEIKLFWPEIPLDLQWKHRSKSPAFKTQLSYNKMEQQDSPHQQGGTATVISAALTPRCSISGADELGRWSWIKLESDKPIYMVSVYCPCTLSEVGSTFQQHCRQLPPSINPRDSFLTDLVKSIKEWHTQGASCIIGGDFNHDI